MTLNRGQRATLAVVGLLIGAALVLTFRHILPTWAFHAALVALLYEGFTLVDRWAGNTLSEGVWLLSRRPLVPLLFGMGLGFGLGVNFFNVPVAVGVGMLYGHFFWQGQPLYDEMWRNERAA